MNKILDAIGSFIAYIVIMFAFMLQFVSVRSELTVSDTTQSIVLLLWGIFSSIASGWIVQRLSKTKEDKT